MITFFENIFNNLNRQDNHIIIMVVFLALVVISIVLRVVAHLHFRGALFAFGLDARKEVKAKGDVAGLKNRLLRKVVSEYIRTAERAASVAPTAHIVQRAISGMSLLGWRYEAILPFIEGLDAGFLWAGLVLALAFSEQAFMYGSVAVIAFVLTRIFAAFFNARAAKQQLADEMHLYIEREISRFFASDSSGVILRLKNELVEVMEKQAVTYKETMENIGHVMAAVITKTSDNMEAVMSKVSASMTEATTTIGPAVAAAMDEKLINMNATLTTTLSDWEKALGEATRLQTSMNESSERLAHAGGRLQSSSELLATHMQGHSSALSSQLVALVSAIDAIKESVDHFAKQQEALTQQAKYIERNQQTLESSLHSYEESLQGLTGQLGDSLGTFINLHAQTSAQAVNAALKSGIERVANAREIRSGDGQ